MSKVKQFHPRKFNRAADQTGIPIELLRQFEEKESYYVKGIQFAGQDAEGNNQFKVFQSVCNTLEEAKSNFGALTRVKIYPIGEMEKEEVVYRNEFNEDQEKAEEAFERAELERLLLKYPKE